MTALFAGGAVNALYLKTMKDSLYCFEDDFPMVSGNAAPHVCALDEAVLNIKHAACFTAYAVRFMLGHVAHVRKTE